MEQHLGRYLRDDEYIHHINEDKKDNRLENLEMLTGQEHAQRHLDRQRAGGYATAKVRWGFVRP